MRLSTALLLVATMTCAFAAFTPYPNEYNPDDAEMFAHLASLSYCRNQTTVRTLTCPNHCPQVKAAGYKFFFDAEFEISWNHSVRFDAFFNDEQQRVVFAFRGTSTNMQLIIESLQSVIPVPYTLHNISNAYVNKYFVE